MIVLFILNQLEVLYFLYKKNQKNNLWSISYGMCKRFSSLWYLILLFYFIQLFFVFFCCSLVQIKYICIYIKYQWRACGQWHIVLATHETYMRVDKPFKDCAFNSIELNNLYVFYWNKSGIGELAERQNSQKHTNTLILHTHDSCITNMHYREWFKRFIKWRGKVTWIQFNSHWPFDSSREQTNWVSINA